MLIQWGDPEEIDWPQDLDHSGAIDISGGGAGGVSSYSLTTNGYVCFDCGLILQWINNTRNTSWPIQFTNDLLAYALGGTWYNKDGNVYLGGSKNISKTNIGEQFWRTEAESPTISAYGYRSLIAIGY